MKLNKLFYLKFHYIINCPFRPNHLSLGVNMILVTYAKNKKYSFCPMKIYF